MGEAYASWGLSPIPGDSPRLRGRGYARRMSLYARRLVIVSGKGGVGKSTVSAAIGMAAAGRGLRALLIEVASQERMSLLFDQGGPIGYHQTPVYPGLDAFSIDPERALEEYLVSQFKVRAMVERLVANPAFFYNATATT